MTVRPLSGEVDDNGLGDRLDKASKDLIPNHVALLLRKIAESAIEVAKVYPPPPTHKNYFYYRGVGKLNKDGSLSGSKSEKVNQKWSYVEQTISATEVTGIIYNTATYSAWLHHEEMQVSWAKVYGWPTIQGALRAQIGQEAPTTGGRIQAQEINIADDIADVIVEFIAEGA